MGETVSKSCPDVPRLKEGDVFSTRARRFDKSEAFITLNQVNELGRGAFGVVNKMLVREEDSNQSKLCAVKVPGGDGNLAEIELFLLLKLKHMNVVQLFYYFNGVEGREEMIHVVLELVEGGDLFHFLKKHYSKSRGIGVLLEVFSYQMFRGLAYCHSQRVCHRDIKPENLLVNPQTGLLKIADFGCGAELISLDEPHTFYIGTRIFRAPELLFEASRYTFKVDIWSAAVVMTEMVMGIPLFYGGKGARGHLMNIFEYLGLPTDADFDDMNVDKVSLPANVDNKFIRTRFKMFPHVANESRLLDLLEGILVFSPNKRLTAWEACDHDYFDTLEGYRTMPNGQPLPPFYDFSQEELDSMPTHVHKRLGIKG